MDVHALPPASRRVLMYSHDGFGLGHLRRNLNIAQRLVERDPDTSVLLVAGLPGIPGLDLPPGVDLVKLPSIRKVGTERWKPRNLRIRTERLLAMRRSLIGDLAGSFEPHLWLVDYVPAGVWGELVPALRDARRAPFPARVVLGLRDVLDAPEVTRSAWEESGAITALRELYDEVLVYGDRAVFDTAAAYGLDRSTPVRFTGYLTPPHRPAPAGEVRARHGLAPGDHLVLITAGGGADAHPMMRLALRALDGLEGELPLRTVLVTGPLMRAEQVADLRARAAGRPVTVLRSSGEVLDLMAAADLVLTMSAYNTIAESLSLGAPVIAIPRQGPSAEQGMRARLFEDLGLLDLFPVDGAAADLRRLVRQRLARPRLRGLLPAFDGLDHAVDALREGLDAVVSEQAGAAGEVEDLSAAQPGSGGHAE